MQKMLHRINLFHLAPQLTLLSVKLFLSHAEKVGNAQRVQHISYARGSTPRYGAGSLRRYFALPLATMTDLALIGIAFLACGFLLYVLFQWSQEGK